MNEHNFFTIKHVNLRDEVSLFPSVSRVCFSPASAQPAKNSVDTVFVDMFDGNTGCIEGGSVYVMNSMGKTVEIFRLS